jgi:hypothetical protein
MFIELLAGFNFFDDGASGGREPSASTSRQRLEAGHAPVFKSMIA